MQETDSMSVTILNAAASRGADQLRGSTPSSMRAVKDEFALDHLPGAVNWPTLRQCSSVHDVGTHVQAGQPVSRHASVAPPLRRATSPSTSNAT
jgi:hypothetical protein